MSVVSALLKSESLEAVRQTIVGYCIGQGLKVTNWIAHGVSNQIKEVCVAMGKASADSRATIVRGFYSLDTATDPGDFDPYNAANVNLPEDDGYLSDHGLNVHGITRTKAGYAKGFALFRNDGASSRNILPESLTYEWKNEQNETFSYRNVADSTIYTNPDGTVTVPVGGQVTMPVECNQLGAAGSCPSNSIYLVTGLLGCSGTNPDPIVGRNRQPADNYRAVCRSSSSRLSFNGPGTLYDYLARYNLDGTPLLRSTNPDIPVDITRTWISEESSTGIVNAYFATDSGPAIQVDVDAANANIEMQSFAVGDCITYTGVPASSVTIAITGTARIKNRPGLDRDTIVQGILDALIAAQRTFPIGGLDQDQNGSGYIYKVDVQAIARGGYAGLYDVVATMANQVSISRGAVAVFSSGLSDWTITFV